MPYKLRLWSAFIVIIALCWIDYQYFTESMHAINRSGTTREVAHLIFLVLITAVGTFGWGKFPQQWIKKVWLFTYGAAMVLLMVIGLMYKGANLFSVQFMKQVSDVRLFFCSPVPYFILYILSVLTKEGKLQAAE